MSPEMTAQEERDEEINGILGASGRAYVHIENPWFANEKFGFWEQEVLATIEQTTDDAVLLSRVVPLDEPLGHIRRHKQMAEVDPEVPDESLQEYLGRVFKAAWGEPRKRAVSGWLPKSQVGQMRSHDGPEAYHVFEDGEVLTELGLPQDADAVVMEYITVDTKYRRYKKLAVDCGYDAGQALKGFEWERFHPSAEYSRSDEFMCWTADDKPVKLAEELSSDGFMVAVHQRLID